jgi:hypothetical protein
MSPEWISVESTAVEAVAYEDGELFVEYTNNGGSYVYSVVPEHVFDELMDSDSFGLFLNQEIKPNYAFRKLE